MIRKLTNEHRRHIISARDLNASENYQQILFDVYDVCEIGSGPGGAIVATGILTHG